MSDIVEPTELDVLLVGADTMLEFDNGLGVTTHEREYIFKLAAAIKEQRTTIATLRMALEEAQPHLCSFLCPSTWKTAEGQPPHHPICQAITSALDAENNAPNLRAALQGNSTEKETP